jgi:hypothetical protein
MVKPRLVYCGCTTGFSCADPTGGGCAAVFKAYGVTAGGMAGGRGVNGASQAEILPNEVWKPMAAKEPFRYHLMNYTELPYSPFPSYLDLREDQPLMTGALPPVRCRGQRQRDLHGAAGGTVLKRRQCDVFDRSWPAFIVACIFAATTLMGTITFNSASR